MPFVAKHQHVLFTQQFTAIKVYLKDVVYMLKQFQILAFMQLKFFFITTYYAQKPIILQAKTNNNFIKNKMEKKNKKIKNK